MTKSSRFLFRGLRGCVIARRAASQALARCEPTYWYFEHFVALSTAHFSYVFSDSTFKFFRVHLNTESTLRLSPVFFRQLPELNMPPSPGVKGSRFITSPLFRLNFDTAKSAPNGFFPVCWRSWNHLRLIASSKLLPRNASRSSGGARLYSSFCHSSVPGISRFSFSIFPSSRSGATSFFLFLHGVSQYWRLIRAGAFV